MAQRSLWHGAISFGLIYVPVDLYSASRDRGLELHFLDSRDFAPVGYERINKNTGKSVDWQHIVKGYEYAKGEYVALSDADFKHANAKASETIDITSFTDAAEISPALYQTPYYLLPGKGGAKAYALLNEALRTARKVAVASFVMRGREHLCVVTPGQGAMMLVTLRFADEILPPVKPASASAASKSEKLKPAELTMAQKLVQEMTAAWKPQQLHDTYREDLMRRIRAKIRTKQTHSLAAESKEAAKPKAEIIDLMDALKNSLKLRSRHGARPIAGRAKPRRLARGPAR
jgi:DNA end-binding protein Ku